MSGNINNYTPMKQLLSYIFLCFLFINASAQAKDLNYFIDQAGLHSPLIHKSQNENKLLELDLKRTQSILSKPLIDVESNLLFAPIIAHDRENKLQLVSNGNTEDYSGYDLSYSDGGQYQGVVSIHQELLTSGKFKAYSHRNDIEINQNKNRIELSKHDLDQLVSYQYIMCLKDQKQEEMIDSLILKIDDQMSLLQELINHSLYHPSDLLLLQIEAKNYKLRKLDLHAKFRRDFADLNILCGIENSSDIEISDVKFTMNTNSISESGFLKQFDLENQFIEAEQNIFNLKYKPNLSFVANAGMNAIHKPSFNRIGVAAGISFKLTLFDGGQKKIEQNKTLIKKEDLLFRKKNFITRQAIQKSKYLNEIQSLTERVNLMEGQLKDYRRLIGDYKIKIRLGTASIMNIKNILRDMAEKQQEIVLLEMEKKSLINNYNYWNY